MKLLWKLAFKNLYRNRRRTLATAFTVCFGFTGLVLLGGYINYVEKSIRALTVYVGHVGHVSIFKKDGLENFYAKPALYQIDVGLLEKTQAALRVHTEQIEKIGISLTGMGLLSNGVRSVPVIIQGLDPELESFIRTRPEVIAYLPDLSSRIQGPTLEEALKTEPQSISITKGLGQLIARPVPFYKLAAADRDVQLAAKSFSGDFNAVNAELGPQHSTGLTFTEDVSVIAPIKTLQDLLATDGVSSLSVYLNRGFNATDFKALIEKDFASAHLPLEVFPFYDESVGMFYAGNMSFLLSMGLFFFLLILSAVVLSVVNTITIGIIERTKEIGTLRAIGFQPPTLSNLFLQENFLIAVFSVVLGTLLGYAISIAINSAEIRFRPTGVADDIAFKVLPELWICASIAVPMIILTGYTAYSVALRKTKQPLIHLLTDTGASA